MNISRDIVFGKSTGPIDNSPFEVVERKGVGHPDTLSDTLAEKVSIAYSQYCLDRYGLILRHMVDKIALAGGSTKVSFGGGHFIKPIRLYLNCRFTRQYQNEAIPYLDIVRGVVDKHSSETIPLLPIEWIEIVDNTHFAPGPGVVYEQDGTTKNERQFFFEVPEDKFAAYHDNSLRSNDTSTTVSYFPLSKLEQLVIVIENTLNSAAFKVNHPYVGTYIKVMGRRIGTKVDITVCVPFISKYTESKEFYFSKLEELRELISSWVAEQNPEYNTQIHLNTRDKPENSDYYLTLTGTALESGDEGVVGRGNRYNGVIPFTRHMSMEACCGKNPIYHVGKVYTALGANIAREIHEAIQVGSSVFLTSQMGRPLSDPWSIYVETDRELSKEEQTDVSEIINQVLSDPKKVTDQLISGELRLY